LDSLAPPQALGALGERHAGGAVAAAAVAARLADVAHWRVRAAALTALAELGKHAAPYADAARGLLVDDAWQVRGAALRALRTQRVWRARRWRTLSSPTRKRCQQLAAAPCSRVAVRSLRFN